MRRRRWLAVVLCVVALVGAGCGNDNKDNEKASTGGSTLKSKLPDAIQKSGVLRIGSDIEYPPVESFKEGTQEPQGIDIDLANAMAAKLGIKAKFVNDTDFAGIIGAMQAGRFDIIMSAMNDNAERRGKGVDFIDYFTAGTGILVPKGNPKQIKSLDDLCGKSVAVQKGTTQETDTIPPQQTKCTAAGKGKITLVSPEKDTDALLAVKSGRAVAILEDSPVAAYNAKTFENGATFELVGQVIDPGKYGIAVPSNNPKLRDALQAALKAIIADGTYDQILAKWGASSGALKTADLNGG